MAREAKVRVIVDVEDAKRSMDDVNQRIEKSRALGANLASSVQNIARGATAGVALLGAGADRLAGGGLLSALSSDFLGAATAGWEGIIKSFGGNTSALKQYSAESMARDRALDTVRQLVGAGGSISETEVDRLIEEYTALYRPGADNVKLVNSRFTEDQGKRLGAALNSIPAIDALSTKIAELTVAIQSWNPFGR